MELSDGRRLALTTMVLAGVLILWMIFLALHDAGQFEWAWPERALGWFGLAAWTWIGLGVYAIMTFVVGMMMFGVDQTPPGFARGKQRQVQCQDCKAVFMVHDAGNRPLTHLCPNCNALGVYTGDAPPVGNPPKPQEPEKLIQLGLNCHECDHKFKVTDTGKRPLKVSCPNCHAGGAIQ